MKETPGHCEIYNISSDDENIRVQFKEGSSLFISVNRKKAAFIASELQNPRGNQAENGSFWKKKKKRKQIINKEQKLAMLFCLHAL